MMQLGDRYQSYSKLEEKFKEFCVITKTRFYKRDCRTIQYAVDAQLKRSALNLSPKLIYSKIKYVCVHSSDGKLPISRGKSVRRKRVSMKVQECPAYLYFRTSNCGQFLELVAMNTDHNHKDTYTPKRKAEELEKNSNVNDMLQFNKDEEIDINYIKMLEEDDEEDYPENNNVEYIRVTVDPENEFESDESQKLNEDNTMKATILKNNSFKATTQALFNYTGLLAPVFTPFKSDLRRSLNLDVIPKYAKFLTGQGINGVLVNGTSGEGTSLSVYERKLIAEKWMSCARSYQLHVMIQVGGAPLPDVIELAMHAEKQGAHSILCLPDLYIKPTTSEQLINYLKIVSDSAPNTPLLYYHIPMFTSVNIHMGKFLNDISDRISTFSGIKFTSNALDEGIEAVQAHEGVFKIFLGADKLMLGAYALGFNSSIATTLNMFPLLGIKILDNYESGELKLSRGAQQSLSTIVDVITKYGSWVSTMKEAMNILTTIKCGPVRQPQESLTEEQIKNLEFDLETYKIYL